MPSAPLPRPRHLPAAALLLLLATGCTGLRTASAELTPRIPIREGIAEPQAQAWLESVRRPSPEEAEAAAAEARTALRRALARRALAEGDQLLAVRAQGVCRTGSRRTAQGLGQAGAGVVSVVVVVGAFLAVLGGNDVDLSSCDFGGEAPVARAAPQARGQWPELLLPPLPPFEPGERGFFAGDVLRLELSLVDRKTGTPLWSKVVEEEGDLRDLPRVKALLDSALDDPGGWVPAPPPAEQAPDAPAASIPAAG